MHAFNRHLVRMMNLSHQGARIQPARTCLDHRNCNFSDDQRPVTGRSASTPVGGASDCGIAAAAMRWNAATAL